MPSQIRNHDDGDVAGPSIGTLLVESREVTLANCEREPIHIPGAIQPHGALVAFDAGTGTVIHASRNLGRWLPVGDLPARGRSLADLFGDEAGASVLRALTATAGGAIRHRVVDLKARPAEGQPEALEVVVHSHRGMCIAELEPACLPEMQLDWMQLLGESIDALRSANDLEALVQRAARRVKRLTGFDRVMVYRFDSDWNGHVIADEHEADMESFYDLHYPASDIPAQARELYRSNLVRYIADVGYTPVPVLPWLNHERPEPLDMSHAVLRSASPIHIQYLRNMGVGATLTISLLVEGRLWGLIACHHRTPRSVVDRVPVRLRHACHALSVTAGYMVGWHEQRERAAEGAALSQAQVQIIEAFNHLQAPLLDVVEHCGAALLRTASARSGAFWRDDTVLPFGQWPAGHEGGAIVRFARRALETSTSDVSHADTAFLEPSADSPDELDLACGFLAVRLDAFAASGIVWVRSATRREVSWGGDPDKPIEVVTDAEGRAIMSPRSSFERWLTIVKGRCLPWTDMDIRAARSLLALTPLLAVRDSLAQVSLSDRRFRSLVALQSDAYCQLDTEGRIVTLSKRLPTGRGSVEGQTLVALFASACAAAEVEALDRALKSQRPFRDLRLHGLPVGGSSEFVVRLGGEPLRDQYGRTTGWHGTITDTTLEVAMQNALRQKEAAEMSSLAKTKFLSQMSHELRTPLIAVLGFSELLMIDRGISEPQREKLRHIQRAGNWLLEMISDLMDLSQIETGRLSLKLEAVDVRAVIADTMSMVDAQAAAADMHLVNEDYGRPVWVRADKSRLMQVLVNLASNALKYNRLNGDVRFTVKVDDALGTTCFAVHDTGVGLTPEQIGNLFQPFNRLGRENQHIQGTGIGLVIARQLVEAMGGRISVESVVGQGSTFSVTLASAEPGPAIATPSPVPNAIAGSVAERIVLYVGDDASNVLLVQSIVESMPDVRLMHADTAERALELSRELSPAVVLIDIKLAGLPGMHLLKSIKSDPGLRHLRCIAVDAGATDEAFDELKFAGFEGRWMKPIDLKAVWSGLSAVLAATRPTPSNSIPTASDVASEV